MISLFHVHMAADVADYVLPVLHSGYIGEGEKTKEFERRFGAFIGNENVVVVNSGTSALTMALKLVGVGYGDRVISTPVTCLATTMAILSVGAVPAWADVRHDGTLNPLDVWQKADETRAKAIMCMDWGGLPCRLNLLKQVGNHFGIPVIEDACQSIGSRYMGRHVGSDVDCVAFSTQAIKMLTTGDGGILSINRGNPQVETAKMMRWFGLDRSKGADMRCNQDPPVAGYKWQMNDVAASIGLANLRGLDERIERTKRHAAIYNERFGIKTDPNRESAYWLYTIFVKDVDGFIQYMKENGVECSRVHDRNDTKTVFRESRVSLPGVDWFDKHHVCLPVGYWLLENEVGKIVDLVTAYSKKGGLWTSETP